MSNKYGLTLKAPVDQSVLPVMYQSGRIIGYALIASTTFTGAETTFSLPDGLALPLTSVTLDVDPTQPYRVTQYMAAVFSDGLSAKLQPWASEHVLSPDMNETPYRMWSLPAQTWALRYVPGNLVTALSAGMDLTTVAPTTPGAPSVTTPATLQWQASINYATLTGDCPFFDFNWVALFKASSTTEAIRIVVTGNPPPVAPATVSPIVAKVVGMPVIVGQNVVLYNTIRIMRLVSEITAGVYTFNFNVYDELGQVTPAVLTLTVQ